MLESVEWDNFTLSQIFNRIEQGRRLKKDDQILGEIPFVMAGVTNTGVVNYISNPVASFPANSITVDIFGNAFYRSYAFGAGDDTGVYWNDEIEYSPRAMIFLTSVISKSLLGKYSYGSKLRSSQSFGFKIRLNLDFMEKFVAELEAYLSAAGLKDYTLTADEERAFADFGQQQWRRFNLHTLFGKATRGKRLKSDDRISGCLPFVTAGEADTGISAFIGNPVHRFKANTVTIDMFGSAKYRNYEYGADDHVAVVHTDELEKMAVLFITSAIHKAAYTGEFHYGRNFYAKDADDLMINLPVKDGEPDYAYMQTLISAVQKQVIKDVVRYADEKISATQTVIAR